MITPGALLLEEGPSALALKIGEGVCPVVFFFYIFFTGGRPLRPRLSLLHFSLGNKHAADAYNTHTSIREQARR
jgi:hypothetical protein